MKTKNKRYVGEALTKYSFTKEFSVECPKCKKEALVVPKTTFLSDAGELKCSHCGWKEKTSDLIRYNAVVIRNCDNCGKSIDKLQPNNKEKVKELLVKCIHCKTTRKYKPRNDEYKIRYKSAKIGDPVFNLPLWFKSQVKGNILWAYNRKHILEIHDYVSSTLRERQTLEYTTMVERLPSFITAAKNRAAVLKALDKMLKK